MRFRGYKDYVEKNIRFKLSIGAEPLGYRSTAVWVKEHNGKDASLSLQALVLLPAGISICT